METIGGGIVLEPAANKHKRFNDEIIEQMMDKEKGNHGKMYALLGSLAGLPSKAIKDMKGVSDEHKEMVLAILALLENSPPEVYAYDMYLILLRK